MKLDILSWFSRSNDTQGDFDDFMGKQVKITIGLGDSGTSISGILDKETENGLHLNTGHGIAFVPFSSIIVMETDRTDKEVLNDFQ